MSLLQLGVRCVLKHVSADYQTVISISLQLMISNIKMVQRNIEVDLLEIKHKKNCDCERG